MAQKLGWKSVKKMQAGLSNLEYHRWTIYYGRIAQRKELAEKEMKGVSTI